MNAEIRSITPLIPPEPITYDNITPVSKKFGQITAHE